MTTSTATARSATRAAAKTAAAAMELERLATLGEVLLAEGGLADTTVCRVEGGWLILADDGAEEAVEVSEAGIREAVARWREYSCQMPGCESCSPRLPGVAWGAPHDEYHYCRACALSALKEGQQWRWEGYVLVAPGAEESPMEWGDRVIFPCRVAAREAAEIIGLEEEEYELLRVEEPPSNAEIAWPLVEVLGVLEVIENGPWHARAVLEFEADGRVYQVIARLGAPESEVAAAEAAGTLQGVLAAEVQVWEDWGDLPEHLWSSAAAALEDAAEELWESVEECPEGDALRHRVRRSDPLLLAHLHDGALYCPACSEGEPEDSRYSWEESADRVLSSCCSGCGHTIACVARYGDLADTADRCPACPDEPEIVVYLE